MKRLPSIRIASFAAFLSAGIAQVGVASEWTKLLDHPPAGANTVVLVNVDALRFGAAKLRQSKDKQQHAASANLLAELPEHSKRAAISASIDFDTLEPIWESGSVTFDRATPIAKQIAEKEGGYVDQISGKPAIWSPRGRYILPHGTDRIDVHMPANRPAVARWIRSLGQAPQPMGDYLKRTSERALDGTALLLAVDMADTVSPTQIAEKLATLKSVASANVNRDGLAKLLGDLQGFSFSATVSDQFMGQLQLDFGSAPTLLAQAGQKMLIEACSRRGMLLPELRDWTATVEGRSFVLSGPLDASSIISILSFFTSSPSADDSPQTGLSTSKENGAPPSQVNPMAQASKNYYSAVDRVLQECRNTRGLSVGERGVFNDRLSRKIDRLPLLNVDKDLLDYGANVAQLLRGAAVAIRSANVAAGGQKATQASSSRSVGYAFSSYSFNDNTAYNESLTNQAHAEGMQQHLTNMQQVDTMTADIRRLMTERYMIEF